jgi:hypothetical protein
VADRKPHEIERKIHFYRADAGADDSGAPVALDLEAIVAAVEQVPFGPESKRYWQQRGGDAIGLWTDSAGNLDRFSLAAVRRSSLPQSELNGTLAALNLGAGAGLHEPIHIRVFQNNIVGVEFNFYGPRPSRLPLYLRHVVSSSPKFVLEALLNQDAQEKLSHYSELRMLEFYVRPSYAQEVREASKSFGKAIAALSETSKADVLGLILRPEPNQRHSLGGKALRAVQKLAGRSDLAENVLRFKAKGVNDQTGRVEVVDVLDDQLVSKQRIITVGATSRAVDPVAAYEAIGSAYQELRPQLLVAAGISIAESAHAGQTIGS